MENLNLAKVTAQQNDRGRGAKEAPATRRGIHVESNKLIEIRWHARGGQGAVTAAKTLAEMVLPKDLHFQAFPEYGPERMGAPIKIFNRISPEPINTYSGVDKPDMVVVVDATLLDFVDVTSGLKKGGIIIVNTGLDPGVISDSYPLEGFKLYTLDATHIALDTLGRPFANIPMLGAVLKITGLLSREDSLSYLEKSFARKFPPEIVKKNLDALNRAFEEVRQDE